MDGWLDGWMVDGWVAECVGGWKNGWVEGQIDGWMADSAAHAPVPLAPGGVHSWVHRAVVLPLACRLLPFFAELHPSQNSSAGS